MSGHSKWNNIKRKKEATDGAKAKIFTKMGREIMVAVKEGGGADASSNGRLRDAIAKAKANNVPNDNIDRAIKRAVAEGDRDSYENIVYEGYGPSGVAVIVDTLTDNRNRTAGDLRHYFDKCGGNLGQSGSVSFMFTRKGVLAIEDEDGKLSEETVMDDCFESGAEDLNFEDGIYEITTDPNELGTVRDALTAKGYTFAQADVAYLPVTTSAIEDEDLRIKMSRLLDMLEDNDDVQDFWHNWENPIEDEEEE